MEGQWFSPGSLVSSNNIIYFNYNTTFQLIASTAIYLAGKVEESHVTIRDVVNVSYRYHI